MVGSSGRTLLGTAKGNVGIFARIATMISSSGFIRTVSFQPSSLGSVVSDCPVPADPVDHLHVDQVEVDAVGVNAVMCNLPELGLIGTEYLGGRIYEA